MKKLKISVKNVLNTIFGNKLFKNKLPKNKNIKSILIISLYFTGDLLFHSALIEMLSKIYPNAKIDIWTKSRSKDIVDSNPLVSDTIIYDNVKTAGYREKTKLDLTGKLSHLKRLKAGKYDVIIDLTGKYSTALFTLLAKPKYSIGINYNYCGFCYDKFIPLQTSTEPGHLIEKYLSVIKHGLNIHNEDWIKLQESVATKPYIYINEEDKRIVDKLLTEKFNDKNSIFIVIHLTSGWEAKELPVIIFAEVFNYLHLSGIKYLIVGDKNDLKKVIELSSIINDSHQQPENYLCNLSLTQSAELIRRSALFIGSDSAPLHMAGAFNTHSIGIFGPTNPGFSNPIGINHKVIYHQLHCSATEDRQYCTRNGGFTCPLYECMLSVRSNEIISLINEIFSGNKGKIK